MRRALLVALTSAALALGGTATAVATGDDSGPRVLGPASSAPQYSGFHGPFEVDLANAPAGDYEYWVQDGSGVVGSTEPLSWDGTGSPERNLTTAELSPGSYTFVVHQDAFEVPDATLSFTVRPGARPACSLRLPGVLRVGAGQEKVVGRLGADCGAAQVTYASWDVYRVGGGFLESLQFPGRAVDAFSFFAAKDRLGLYQAVPRQATNAAGDDFGRNAPRIDVRLDSRLVLRTHRSGTRVTLTAVLRRYLPGAGRYGAWARRQVTVATRACGSCAWHRVAVRRTNRSGRVVVHLRVAKVRGYRISAGGTSSVWAPHARYGRR